MSTFSGEVAWVTGSSTGIGRAIALDLASAGCRVVVHYNSSEDEAREVVGEIESSGGEAMTVRGDVADSGDVGRMVGEIEDRFGTPSASPHRACGSSGVSPSPRNTTFEASRTGSNSRQRHMPPDRRRASESLVRVRAAFSRS